MNVILKEMLFNMTMVLPWLIQGHLSWVWKVMFFLANVRRYSIVRFSVNQVGHLLLDMMLACFIGSVCFSLMESTTTMMA
jgi:hypothetical protein